MTIHGEYWWVQWRPGGWYWAQRQPGRSLPLREGECPDRESLPVPPEVPLVLCVPGSLVRIHKVNIPARNRRRFLAALPFALEDRLFRPVEAYHLVPLRRPAVRAATPIAVLEHEWMTSWLKEIEPCNWRLAMLVPDYLFMPPPKPDAWLLDGTAAPLLLRFPEPAGGAALSGGIETHPPAGLLLALEQAQPPPRRLVVRVQHREQWERVKAWRPRLEAFELRLEQEQADVPRSPWLARQALPPAACNLLTHRYRPHRNKHLPARRFVPAAILATALLALLAAQWWLGTARTREEHEHLTQSIETVYREAFPDAVNLVDPRYQMEQGLAALRSLAGNQAPQQADVLAWMERLAPLVRDETGSQLQSLGFDGESIVLALSLPHLEALERLQERLAELALVKVEHVELRDGRVHGRIHLEEQA